MLDSALQDIELAQVFRISGLSFVELDEAVRHHTDAVTDHALAPLNYFLEGVDFLDALPIVEAKVLLHEEVRVEAFSTIAKSFCCLVQPDHAGSERAHKEAEREGHVRDRIVAFDDADKVSEE